MSKLRKQARAVLANPDQHSAAVVYFATELDHECGLRDDAARTLRGNRQAHRLFRQLQSEGRNGLQRRAVMVQKYDHATYLAVSNACHRVGQRPLFAEQKLRAYLALETAPRSAIATLHFILTSRDKDKKQQAAVEYPDIFDYSPEQVSEILCWRLLRAMPAGEG